MAEKIVKNKFWSILIIIILFFSGLLIVIPIEPNPTTAKAESTWIQTTDKDFFNGTSENISIYKTGDDSELRIDISDLQTWTKKTTSTKPVAGTYHAMSSVWGTDNTVLFGGYWYFGGSWYYNETWVFDYSDNAWTRKFPLNKPTGRIYHGMTHIDGTDKVLLFGGYLGATYYTDTWIYDLSDNTWTSMNPISAPTSRLYHSMAPIVGTDKVLLFGGWYSQYLDDTWIYDLSDNTWMQMLPQAKPNSRYLHTIAPIGGTDKVLLYGGYFYFYDDTWVYDLSDNNWTKMNPSNRPPGRYWHAMSTIPGTDQILLFGGYAYFGTGYRYLNDSWIYDYSDDTWTLRKTKRSPGAGRYQAMAPVFGTDRIVLFGGYNPAYGYWDETWIYRHNLPTRNGTYISKPYDTGSNSSYKSISWYGKTPINTSIKIQLRSAKNESILTGKSFIGPNGSASKYYTSTFNELWPGHNSDRWIQYKVYFNMSVFTDSPILRDIIITYNTLPCTNVIGPGDQSLLSHSKPTFTWTFSDIDCDKQNGFQVLIDDNITFNDVDYNSGEQNIADQSWEFPSGTSYLDLPDGTWFWKVRTKDSDDEWTQYSKPISLTIDTHAPSSAPTMPINNDYCNSLDTISGISTDPKPGSGVIQIELAIKRLSDNYYWNGIIWSPLVNWLLVSGTDQWEYDSSAVQWRSGYQYSIQSRALDNASNLELVPSENKFSIDIDSPESFIDYPIDNSWVKALETISGSSIDTGGSDVKEVEISINRVKDDKYWHRQGWDPVDEWLTVKGTDQWTYNSSKINWITGEQYILRSRATDRSNNEEVPTGKTTFRYDALEPNKPSIIINNGDEYTISNNVVLSLTAADLGSGVSQMSFRASDETWTTWKTFNTTKEYELPIGDGVKVIEFRVRDFAGNIPKPAADIIILDTDPPKDLSLVINNDAEFTNSHKVTLTLNAMDSLSGLNNMSFSYNSNIWLPWEPFKLTRSIYMPPGDRGKYIYFRVTDKAGNIAESVYDSIVLDTTPPELLSIMINDGVSQTNSTLVTLKLKATDKVSKVDQIAFSIDGEYWSSWEDYTESKMYNLPVGYGVKTIYFRAMDRAGNIAKPVMTSILLNATTSINEQKASPSEKFSSSTTDIWYVILIIILIIFFCIITAVITRRMNRIEQHLVTSGAMPFKPGNLSTPALASGGGLGVVSTSQQLPPVGGGTGIRTPNVRLSGAATALPVLAKFSADAKVSSSQPTSQIAALPQLPPANINNNTEGTNIKTEPSIAENVTTTNSSTETKQAQKPVLNVHLPDQTKKIPNPIHPVLSTADRDKE